MLYNEFIMVKTLVKKRTRRDGRVRTRTKRRARIMAVKNSCCYCNKHLTIETSTIEHIIPRSLGGSNDHSNLDIACRECNSELGSVLSNLINLRSVEKKIEEINFRNSLIGRILNVFFPKKIEANHFENRAAKLQSSTVSSLAKFKNYKHFYTKLIEERYSKNGTN